MDNRRILYSCGAGITSYELLYIILRPGSYFVNEEMAEFGSRRRKTALKKTAFKAERCDQKLFSSSSLILSSMLRAASSFSAVTLI